MHFVDNVSVAGIPTSLLRELIDKTLTTFNGYKTTEELINHGQNRINTVHDFIGATCDSACCDQCRK